MVTTSIMSRCDLKIIFFWHFCSRHTVGVAGDDNMLHILVWFIKEYRGPTLRPPCDVIDVVIIMKIFWHNLGRSFHIWGQLEAVFNISKFSKRPPFWARDKPFYQRLYRVLNIPERWHWAFPTFWHFDRRCSSNIDGDVSITKFDLLCDLVTSMTSWVRET